MTDIGRPRFCPGKQMNGKSISSEVNLLFKDFLSICFADYNHFIKDHYS